MLVLLTCPLGKEEGGFGCYEAFVLLASLSGTPLVSHRLFPPLFSCLLFLPVNSSCDPDLNPAPHF